MKKQALQDTTMTMRKTLTITMKTAPMIIPMEKQIQGTFGQIPLVEWIVPSNRDDDKDRQDSPDPEGMQLKIEGGLRLGGKCATHVHDENFALIAYKSEIECRR